MERCVKCGSQLPSGADACSECTWPVSRKGWDRTSWQIRHLTLDTNCVNAREKNEDLNTLERWARTGLLELQRSDVMLEEIQDDPQLPKATSMATHPDLFTLGESALNGPDVLAGPDLGQELRRLLFPTEPFTLQQRRDVEHLRRHVQHGADVFVTEDKKGFIDRGLQDELMARGIWVMPPNAVVKLLAELYGWQ